VIEPKIQKVLNSLEEKIKYQKVHECDIPQDDTLLAIGHESGLFLNTLLKSQDVKKILEIGTSFGYSTLWFADVIGDTGKIITIEANEKKIVHATENFTKAGVSDRIKIIKGQALDVLSDNQYNEEKFDFVFIDADKENIIKYFNWGFSHLRPKGMVVIDNMLYPEKFKPYMSKLHTHIQKTPNAQTSTCPIGNGLEITLKLKITS